MISLHSNSIYVRIIMPLQKPKITVLGVFNCRFTWVLFLSTHNERHYHQWKISSQFHITTLIYFYRKKILIDITFQAALLEMEEEFEMGSQFSIYLTGWMTLAASSIWQTDLNLALTRQTELLGAEKKT